MVLVEVVEDELDEAVDEVVLAALLELVVLELEVVEVAMFTLEEYFRVMLVTLMRRYFSETFCAGESARYMLRVPVPGAPKFVDDPLLPGM